MQHRHAIAAAGREAQVARRDQERDAGLAREGRERRAQPGARRRIERAAGIVGDEQRGPAGEGEGERAARAPLGVEVSRPLPGIGAVEAGRRERVARVGLRHGGVLDVHRGGALDLAQHGVQRVEAVAVPEHRADDGAVQLDESVLRPPLERRHAVRSAQLDGALQPLDGPVGHRGDRARDGRRGRPFRVAEGQRGAAQQAERDVVRDRPRRRRPGVGQRQAAHAEERLARAHAGTCRAAGWGSRERQGHQRAGADHDRQARRPDVPPGALSRGARRQRVGEHRAPGRAARIVQSQHGDRRLGRQRERGARGPQPDQRARPPEAAAAGEQGCAHDQTEHRGEQHRLPERKLHRAAAQRHHQHQRRAAPPGGARRARIRAARCARPARRTRPPRARRRAPRRATPARPRRPARARRRRARRCRASERTTAAAGTRPSGCGARPR